MTHGGWHKMQDTCMHGTRHILSRRGVACSIGLMAPTRNFTRRVAQATRPFTAWPATDMIGKPNTGSTGFPEKLGNVVLCPFICRKVHVAPGLTWLSL
eukprot:3313450-Lingulodinium_polyedra.AAC.1